RFTGLSSPVFRLATGKSPEPADRNVCPTFSMIRQLTITPEPIDEAALLRQRQMSDGMGAAIYFLGVVRGDEEGQAIRAIDYEAFHKMAEHQFNRLFDEMEKRWPIESVRLVHRIGVV